MTPITVRNPAEAVAVTPYLIGFHPADSIVVLGLIGRIADFAVRYDLPRSDAGRCDVGRLIAMQGSDRAFVIGYGPPDRVTPAVLTFARLVAGAGVPIAGTIRVAEGRWWSYSGDGPAEGTPFAPGLAATAVLRGLVALPDRKALTARVAPVEGASRQEMTLATARARDKITDLLGDDVRAGRSGKLVRKAGKAALAAAEKHAAAARKLSADETAWLGMLLIDPAVLDHAIDRVGPEEWRQELWTDVLRRVEPGYVPGPASLLGLQAWLAGDGSLARVAVDRALLDDPAHRTAGALDRLLAAGIRPHLLAAGFHRGCPPPGGGREH